MNFAWVVIKQTNYINATLAIYLDLFNIFQSLLAILGITAGDD